MMKRIDIIIPYIMGPDHGMELKYALRSIAKNFKHDNYRIIIVGDKPEWLNTDEAVYFEFARIPHQKYRNFTDQLLKLYSALTELDVSAQFVWTYDDVYFTREVNFTALKQLKAVASFDRYPRHLDGAGAGPNWRGTLNYTMQTVREEGGSNYNYETHLPRVFSKSRVLKLIDKYNLLGRPMMLSSLYNNLYYADKEPLCLFDNNPGIRFLLRSMLDVETTKKHMQKHLFTNNAPKSWHKVFQKALMEEFIEKSKYEV